MIHVLCGCDVKFLISLRRIYSNISNRYVLMRMLGDTSLGRLDNTAVARGQYISIFFIKNKTNAQNTKFESY